MAVPIGLEVGEALILVEGVSDGVPGDDLVVVGAVREDLGEAVLVGDNWSVPVSEQHFLKHLANFVFLILLVINRTLTSFKYLKYRKFPYSLLSSI